MSSWLVGGLQMLLACDSLRSLPATGHLNLVHWLSGPRPLALAVLQCTDWACKQCCAPFIGSACMSPCICMQDFCMLTGLGIIHAEFWGIRKCWPVRCETAPGEPQSWAS